MQASFIHLSDIHFGQERGAEVFTQNDVKEQLIVDAHGLATKYASGALTGIIVTGDIAYAGKREEYVRAGEWLDRLAAAIGCSKTAVEVVPGNHDIDRKAISAGCKMMIADVLENGEVPLNAFLNSPLDRETLYARFADYRPFAEGYDCPLDREGHFGKGATHTLAPGRELRFIGLNTALVCSADDEEGKLLLGTRQHILPRQPGVELVVLAHHPLNWLRDSEEARRYVRSRARVFVSGHEHSPSLDVQHIKDGCDLMMLAAGATVPPTTDEVTYCYNLLIFEWDEASDGLRVTIVPRAWNEEDTAFEADDQRLGGLNPSIVLGCPNFRALPNSQIISDERAPAIADEHDTEEPEASGGPDGAMEASVMTDRFELLLLRFFRDLSPAQRIETLVAMNALPPTWREPLTHTIERAVIDGLRRNGKLEELGAAMEAVIIASETKGEE